MLGPSTTEHEADQLSALARGTPRFLRHGVPERPPGPTSLLRDLRSLW